MRLMLPSLFLAAIASSAVAGEEPAIRPLAQASTKSALGETKLPEELVSEVYGDIQSFTHGWATRVLEEGNSAAVRGDLRTLVDEGVRDKLQARGIGITQQEAIIDALRLRAEAALQDFDRMAAAQAGVKRALEASGTEEPALSAVFDEIKDFASYAHGWVVAPGVAGAEREAAAAVVEREIGPLLDENDVPAKHRAELLKQLATWLESRAAVEGDAGR
jgi:hypothetical protein